MKIAITADGRELNSCVDERFGRAKGFIIYDLDSGTFDSLENGQAADSLQGAGIQAAKAVINAGASVLITGNVGPKAHAALSAAKIAVFTGAKGAVQNAIGDYRSGILIEAKEANVEGRW